MYYYEETGERGKEIREGDRVQCTVNHPDDSLDLMKGDYGTVIVVLQGSYQGIGVRWDTVLRDGHSLFDRCEDHHGWWMFPGDIKLCGRGSGVHDNVAYEPANSAEILGMLGMK